MFGSGYRSRRSRKIGAKPKKSDDRVSFFFYCLNLARCQFANGERISTVDCMKTDRFFENKRNKDLANLLSERKCQESKV